MPKQQNSLKYSKFEKIVDCFAVVMIFLTLLAAYLAFAPISTVYDANYLASQQTLPENVTLMLTSDVQE